MTLDNVSALVFYALFVIAAYLLVPFLLILLVLILAIPGFIVSMFTRERWK